MVKNMGKVDKIARIAAALVIGILVIAGVLKGVAAVILGLLAVVFIATSAVGTCPLYLPFGISTRKNQEK
ncbi:MAG: DUF2892 domain-containing protein [Spirochaetes bacterium]|nr:DUF2892 domain-containing protein [Spirochaetota bacterium]